MLTDTDLLTDADTFTDMFKGGRVLDIFQNMTSKVSERMVDGTEHTSAESKKRTQATVWLGLLLWMSELNGVR